MRTKPPLSETWADAAPAGPTGIEDPGGLKSTGWTAASACPPFSWMNWILNKCDAAARYRMAAGISAYDANEDYVVGDTVRAPTDGKCYECILANGHAAAKEPHVNPTYWSRWGHTDADIDVMLPTVVVVTTTTGIAITGTGSSAVSGVVCTAVGFASASKRITFVLTFGDNGAAVVTFSGDKLFASRASTVLVSAGTTAVTARAVISDSNVITVSASGVTGGSQPVYVTVEGY
jgi:hypothetical protein